MTHISRLSKSKWVFALSAFPPGGPDKFPGWHPSYYLFEGGKNVFLIGYDSCMYVWQIRYFYFLLIISPPEHWPPSAWSASCTCGVTCTLSRSPSSGQSGRPTMCPVGRISFLLVLIIKWEFWSRLSIPAHLTHDFGPRHTLLIGLFKFPFRHSFDLLWREICVRYYFFSIICKPFDNML